MVLCTLALTLAPWQNLHQACERQKYIWVDWPLDLSAGPKESP